MNDRERENFILQFLATANETECSDQFTYDMMGMLAWELNDMFPLLDEFDNRAITRKKVWDSLDSWYVTTSKELKESIHEHYPERLI